MTTTKWAAANAITAVWTDGKLIISGVEGSDKPIEIDLNAYLKALVYKPEMVLDGQNAMEYIYVPYKPIVVGEAELSLKYAHQRYTADGFETVYNYYLVGETTSHDKDVVFLNPTYDKLYSLDPSTAIVPEYTQTNLGTISQDPDFVKTTRAASVPNYAANPAAAKPTATYLDVKDGIMHVGITMDGHKVMTQEEKQPENYPYFYPAESDPSKITDLAVTAPLGEGKETITSTWASVYASQMVVESLAYTDFAKQYTYVDPELEHSSYVWDAKSDKFVQVTGTPGNLLGHGSDAHLYPVQGGMHLYHGVHQAAQMVATLELAYNSKEGINLNKLVSTHAVYNSRRSWNAGYPIKALSESELKDLGMKYIFKQVPFAIGETSVTGQTQNHSVLQSREDGTYIVACGVKSNSDTDPLKSEADLSKIGNSIASVGRTPLVRVELTDTVNNKVVESGYIKFIIVQPEKPIITKVFDLGNFYYQCVGQGQSIAWHAIEQNVYDDGRGMSKETFNLLYEAVSVGHTVLPWEYGDLDPNEPYTELAQWEESGTDIYGNPTFTLSKKPLGAIFEIKEADSETTNTLVWLIDRADFVNCVNDGGYPAVTEQRYIKFSPKKGLGDSNFNKEPVYLPIKFTLCYPQGVMANKIPKYWYADGSFNPANSVLDKDQLKNIHGNVEAPGNETDVKKANADFNVYLDERFAKTTTGHAHAAQQVGGNLAAWKPSYFCFYNESDCNQDPENAPSFTINPDAFDPAQAWNTPENFPSFVQEELVYVYYFTLANEGRKVKGVSGKEYTLSVDNKVANNPVMLYTDTPKVFDAAAATDFESKNTVLKADGVAIAEIQYGYASTTYGDPATREHEAKLVVLNNATTKDLINVPAGKASLDINDTENVIKFFDATFDVNLGVAVFNEECGAYLPLKDNTFNAELLKPVYVEPLGPAKFTDAVDKGTEVALYDLVKFYDWRAAKGDGEVYEFKKHSTWDLYDYYEVDLITVNPEDIMTDLSGEFKTLKEYSDGVEFQVYDGKGVRLDNGKVVDPEHWCKPGKDAKNYDYLRYYNNTGTVVSFNIRIPVRIHHKWSQDNLIVWVEGTVNRTVGN